MEPLQIAICEDSVEERNKLLAILKQSKIENQAAAFPCGEAFLRTFQPGKYDLVLMDIFMDGMTGVDAVTALRKRDADVPVAFITTSTDYALESYRLDALKYIEKPVKVKAITELLRIAQMKKDDAPRLRLRVRGQDEDIPFAKILYVEQRDHTLLFRLSGGETEKVTDRLDNLAPQFAGQPFFRCHKSYLVNLAQVRALDRELMVFVMKEGGNVHIRRESLGAARRAFEAYLFAAVRKETDE